VGLRCSSAVGIANVMIISVLEQQEIGVRPGRRVPHRLRFVLGRA
jgi:hypothetical protein